MGIVWVPCHAYRSVGDVQASASLKTPSVTRGEALAPRATGACGSLINTPRLLTARAAASVFPHVRPAGEHQSELTPLCRWQAESRLVS